MAEEEEGWGVQRGEEKEEGERGEGACGGGGRLQPPRFKPSYIFRHGW